MNKTAALRTARDFLFVITVMFIALCAICFFPKTTLFCLLGSFLLMGIYGCYCLHVNEMEKERIFRLMYPRLQESDDFNAEEFYKAACK